MCLWWIHGVFHLGFSGIAGIFNIYLPVFLQLCSIVSFTKGTDVHFLLLILSYLFLIVSGVWNSKDCGSDVSMENVENPTSPYYDSSLQDILPLWASSLPHHKYFEVQCCHEKFSSCYTKLSFMKFQYAFNHSAALQAIRWTDLECVHLPAVFSFTLWNSGGSNVWNIQPSLCHEWNTDRVRTQGGVILLWMAF